MSLLRHFRHRNDVPLLADEYIGERCGREEKNERVMVARHTRRQALYDEQVVAIPRNLRPYVLSRQHDAGIRDISRTGNRFTLTASDNDVAILAEIVSGVSWHKRDFPFDMVFEGTSYAGWRVVDFDGNLSWCPAPDPSRQSVEWLGDGFIEWEKPGVRWAMEAYVSGNHSRDYQMLLIEAESLNVVERQRATWRRFLGEAGLPLFDEFQERRLELPLLLLQSDVRGLLRERGFVIPEERAKG